MTENRFFALILFVNYVANAVSFFGQKQNKTCSPATVTDWGFSPFSTEISRFLDDFLPHASTRLINRPVGPLLDIKETKDSFEYIIDAPGVKKEDIKVEIRNHALSLEMEKKDERKIDTDQYHRVERYSGYMHRTVPLPENVKEGTHLG